MPSAMPQSERRHYLTVLLLAFLVFALDHFRLIDFHELDASDLRFRLRGRELAHEDLVIVEIDNASLASIGKWPWPPSIHGVLIDILSRYRPRLILYDMLFMEANSDKTEDEKLTEAMGRAGNVLLPFYFYSENPFRAFLPLPILMESARGIGFLNLPVDRDGHVRRMRVSVTGEDEDYDSMPVLAYLTRFVDEEKAQNWLKEIPRDGTNHFLINYPGSREVFKRVSFSEIIRVYETGKDDEIKKLVSDRMVLVGPTTSAISEDYPTPYSPHESSLIIQASALHTLLTGKYIRIPSRFVNLSLLVLFSLFLSWLARVRSPRRGLVFALGFMALYVFVNFLAFFKLRWMLPLTVPMVGGAIVYLIALFFKYFEGWLRGELVSREINTAARIQEAFFPQVVPQLKHLEIAFEYRYAEQMGGDFYDWVELGDDKLGLCVGDVSGKGIPAAIFMARAISDFRRENKTSLEPGEVCRAMNLLLTQNSVPGMFVTLVYVVMDTRQNKLWYANAGHVPLIIYHSKNKKAQILRGATGRPLGLFSESTYGSIEVPFEKGDLLLLMTDGVTEMRNAKGEAFGIERVRDFVEQHKAYYSPSKLIQLLFETLQSFLKGAPPADDQTVVGLEFRSDF
ncbi:MAG: CHASE2 domain-containing protein [Candidatus Omnitrophica bacterium]|nr:CHASE2 domain-containing protein [Candidatus Omnitrophota bacterium]